MGRRWVRRKKQKTEQAHNSLVAGYGSSDDDEDGSDGEAAPASPWEKHVDAATGKPYWHDPATKRTTWDDPSPAPAPAPEPEPEPEPASEPATAPAPAPPPALAPLLPVFRALESELDGISARTGKSPFALDAAARARLAFACVRRRLPLLCGIAGFFER